MEDVDEEESNIDGNENVVDVTAKYDVDKDGHIGKNEEFDTHRRIGNQWSV